MYKGFQCKAILKSGKRKGIKCGRNSVDELCPIHSRVVAKKQKDTTISATYIYCGVKLRSGKRRGELCGVRCKSSQCIAEEICGRHLRFKHNKK